MFVSSEGGRDSARPKQVRPRMRRSGNLKLAALTGQSKHQQAAEKYHVNNMIFPYCGLFLRRGFLTVGALAMACTLDCCKSDASAQTDGKRMRLEGFSVLGVEPVRPSPRAMQPL